MALDILYHVSILWRWPGAYSVDRAPEAEICHDSREDQKD